MLLPKNNSCPRSWYMLKRLVGYQDVKDVEYHVCVNDCHCFGRRPDKGLENSVATEVCPVCSEPRFTTKLTQTGVKWVPRKVFYYFELRQLIQRGFFGNKEWCGLRGTGRDEYPGDFYSSEEAKRIDARLGGALFHPDNSGYEIGMDWAQPYDFKQHSTGVVCIRSVDIPHAHRSKARFCFPVAILPGPKEPSRIEPYLEPLFKELEVLGPGGDGHGLLVFDCHHRRWHAHYAILTGWYGDSPALKKIQLWNSYAARFGCGYCTLRSEPGPNAGGRYYYGYSMPAVCGLDLQVNVATGAMQNGPGFLTMCGHPRAYLTEEAQLSRGRLVDHSEDGNLFRLLGCHGVSPLVKAIPYVSYLDTWVQPVAHSLLFGLVKDFWTLLLQPGGRKKKKKGKKRALPEPGPSEAPWYLLDNQVKRVMASRCTLLAATCDFGRPYRCVVNQRGSWVMEDWMHWTETWSVGILQRSDHGHVLQDERLRTMWQCLRKAVLYFLRMPDCEVGEAPASTWHPGCEEERQASHALAQYSQLCQEHFGHLLCKYNLHIANCRFVRQTHARGHTCFATEYWLETMVKYVKGLCKGNTPELAATSSILLHQLSNYMKFEHGIHSGVISFDDMVPEYGSGPMRGKNLDEVDDEGMLLKGTGKPLKL